MTNIIIDASHAEEKRVAIIGDKNRLEEFEFETSAKQTLKGNIYLAKIMRVEPSLQAAFVDYGGNRHGFLAFSEIHPDYYQIPVADREELEKEFSQAHKKSSLLAEEDLLTVEVDDDEKQKEIKNGKASSQNAGDTLVETETAVNIDAQEIELDYDIQVYGGSPQEDKKTPSETPPSIVEDPSRPMNRRYRIQEIIKRNQILLVQVVKEERGTKGAALTTYLSLAGRYSVLMPNTANAGGISRKISDGEDRKRLRETLKSISLDEKQSLIIRTAGKGCTKAEIKRDFDYLSRTWNEIREKTMNSHAPTLVHEEGDLIRRTIRDLYTKDVETIFVEGESGYKTAKKFMKALLPSHAKKVQHYDDESLSLFRKFKVETQIEELQNPEVSLPSGGYLVINLTEALVAIDINSGKSTKERHIEKTAFNTNMEAASEIARQLRLRDFAGLIVIDFIDMDNSKHTAAVERRVREATKIDRARIQVGRFNTQFGLLVLTRQRLRPSIFETLTQACQTCGGTGHVRSIESTALAILRSLEEKGVSSKDQEIDLYVPVDVALYLFNHKRKALESLEKRFSMKVTLHTDGALAQDGFEFKTPSQILEETNHNNNSKRDQKSSSSSSQENKKSQKQSPEKNQQPQETSKPKKKSRHRRRPKKKDETSERNSSEIKSDEIKPEIKEATPPSETSSKEALSADKNSKEKTSQNQRKTHTSKNQNKNEAGEQDKSKAPKNARPENTKKAPPLEDQKKETASKESSTLVQSVVKPSSSFSLQETIEKKDDLKKGWWKKLLK